MADHPKRYWRSDFTTSVYGVKRNGLRSWAICTKSRCSAAWWRSPSNGPGAASGAMRMGGWGGGHQSVGSSDPAAENARGMIHRPPPLQKTQRWATRRQRPLRKKYTWLVQSIPPASSTSEIRARTSPPMSAGEIVFSSTNITPPWDRSSSAQSFNNGGIILRS
jgi:hypothetical protein